MTIGLSNTLHTSFDEAVELTGKSSHSKGLAY